MDIRFLEGLISGVVLVGSAALLNHWLTVRRDRARREHDEQRERKRLRREFIEDARAFHEESSGLTRPPPPSTLLLRRDITPKAYLVHTSGTRRGSTHQLGRVTLLGRRAADNDVVVDDPCVSLVHARIRLEEEEFVLYDLASRNGTLVNGEPVVRQVLVDGDIIQVGDTTLSFAGVEDRPPA